MWRFTFCTSVVSCRRRLDLPPAPPPPPAPASLPRRRTSSRSPSFPLSEPSELSELSDSNAFKLRASLPAAAARTNASSVSACFATSISRMRFFAFEIALLISDVTTRPAVVWHIQLSLLVTRANISLPNSFTGMATYSRRRPPMMHKWSSTLMSSYLSTSQNLRLFAGPRAKTCGCLEMVASKMAGEFMRASRSMFRASRGGGVSGAAMRATGYVVRMTRGRCKQIAQCL